MSRFELRGDYAMRVMEDSGNLLAFFNVVDTEIGMEYRNGKLFIGKNGVFIRPPEEEYEDAEGNTKYSRQWGQAYDFENEEWDEVGEAYMAEMTEAVYEYYQNLVGEDTEADDDEDEEEAPKKRPAARRAAAKKSKASPKKASPKKSARGPVPTVSGRKGKKLPF